MSIVSWQAGAVTVFFFLLGVGFATRQMGNLVKPNLVLSVDDQGVVSLKSQSTFKTVEIKFKLDEEFDETTADDRRTKVSLSSVMLTSPHNIWPHGAL